MDPEGSSFEALTPCRNVIRFHSGQGFIDCTRGYGEITAAASEFVVRSILDVHSSVGSFVMGQYYLG